MANLWCFFGLARLALVVNFNQTCSNIYGDNPSNIYSEFQLTCSDICSDIYGQFYHTKHYKYKAIYTTPMNSSDRIAKNKPHRTRIQKEGCALRP